MKKGNNIHEAGYKGLMWEKKKLKKINLIQLNNLKVCKIYFI